MAKCKICPGHDKCPGMAKKDEEIARLREALEYIRDWPFENHARDIAREALKCPLTNAP